MDGSSKFTAFDEKTIEFMGTDSGFVRSWHRFFRRLKLITLTHGQGVAKDWLKVFLLQSDEQVPEETVKSINQYIETYHFIRTKLKEE